MKILIAGGTGFIGGHLTHALLLAGHQVVHLSRKNSENPFVTTITWKQLEAQPNQLDGIDAVVNLAGESINQRWTSDAKRRILQSRIQATRAIASWVQQVTDKPSVVVNGSAIGYYGNSFSQTYDESIEGIRATDFLAEVTHAWEEEADKIAGVRLVKLRTGLVLARDGGALPNMALPYRLFIGGPVGSGQQWHSWIHIQDMIRLIIFAIENPSVEGPLNATAPQPEINHAFGKKIGHALRRPNLLPVPAVALKVLFGEMAQLLLEGQRVVPLKALNLQFQFNFPSLELALEDIFNG